MDKELRILELSSLAIICFAMLTMVILSQEDWLSAVGNWFFHWQTLVSGLLATIAAGITIRILWLQLKQSDRREERQIAREHQAQRFLLVFTLSTIVTYSEEALGALKDSVTLVGASGLSGTWQPPVFPIETVRSLSEFLKTSENQIVNERIAFLITQIQVLDARLHYMIDDEKTFAIGIEKNIPVYQLQAAKIYQVAGSLFRYARGERDEIDPGLRRDQLANYLRFNGFGSGNEALARRLERFLARGDYWHPQKND